MAGRLAMARKAEELEALSPGGKDQPPALPSWLGVVGLVVAAGVLLIGIALFGSPDPDPSTEGDPVAEIDAPDTETTTTSTTPPVEFPAVLVAGELGVSVDGGPSLFDECARVAVDDMRGGLVVEECEGPIVHISADGDHRTIAVEEYDLHFVDAISRRGFATMVAFGRADDNIEIVAYDVTEKTTDTGTIPAVAWWSVAPDMQAVVGFDFENEEPAPGCMEVRWDAGPGPARLIGCDEGDPMVIAAAIDGDTRQVAYMALNDLGAYVLNVIGLADDEVVASIRLDAEAVWMDFDGRFVAVTTQSGDGGFQSVVVDTQTYSKKEYEGHVSFIRTDIVLTG